MKLDQRKLSILLVLVYIICVIFSVYTLFTLQNDLVYDAQALAVSEISTAKPVFIKLYLIIGVTLIGGLGILLYLFSNKGMEIIYIEKKEEEKSIDDNEKVEDTENKHFDISSVKGVVTSKTKSEEKILTDGLTEVCKSLEAGIGAFYMVKKDGNKKVLQMNSTYAMSLGESQRPTFEFGEGLVGQVAAENRPLVIDDVPEGYIKIVSGLGGSSPSHLLITPVKYGKDLCGVVEIASFTTLDEGHIKAVDNAFKVITERLFGADNQKTTKEPKKAASKTTAEKKVKGSKKA